jgi:hypothetical protein
MNLKEWSEKPILKKEPKGFAPGINWLPCYSANEVKPVSFGRSVGEAGNVSGKNKTLRSERSSPPVNTGLFMRTLTLGALPKHVLRSRIKMPAPYQGEEKVQIQEPAFESRCFNH